MYGKRIELSEWTVRAFQSRDGELILDLSHYEGYELSYRDLRISDEGGFILSIKPPGVVTDGVSSDREGRYAGC